MACPGSLTLIKRGLCMRSNNYTWRDSHIPCLKINNTHMLERSLQLFLVFTFNVLREIAGSVFT